MSERRKEWVELTDGRRLCVWEMGALQCAEYINRFGTSRENLGDHSLSLLCLTVYEDDQPGAPRVFDGEAMLSIYRLTMDDLARLHAALERVQQGD